MRCVSRAFLRQLRSYLSVSIGISNIWKTEWLLLIHHKTRVFYPLFYSPKMWLLARLGLFTNQNDRLISLLLIHILQLVNSQPFLIPGAWKKHPFRPEPPCTGPREYPWVSRWVLSAMCSSLNKDGTFLNGSFTYITFPIYLIANRE